MELQRFGLRKKQLQLGQVGSPSHSILLLETVVPRADADQEVDKAGDAS